MGLSAVDVTPGRCDCGDGVDHGRKVITRYLDIKALSLPSSFKSLSADKFLSMLIKSVLTITALLFGVGYSWPQYGSPTSEGPGSDGKYTLQAEGIRAKFIPYGASISNLFINDTNGKS